MNTANLIDFMGINGRNPSYTNGGRLRGFRSRQGAPNSERDTMADLGVQRQPWQDKSMGGASDSSAWDTFFHASQNEFDKRLHPFTENGAPGGPQPLAVPTDQPPAAAIPQIQGINDGVQLPGDPPLPPGISLEQFRKDTGAGIQNDAAPPMFQPQQFQAAKGSVAANIEAKYRTPDTAPGVVSFQPNPTANRSSTYPYHG